MATGHTPIAVSSHVVLSAVPLATCSSEHRQSSQTKTRRCGGALDDSEMHTRRRVRTGNTTSAKRFRHHHTASRSRRGIIGGGSRGARIAPTRYRSGTRNGTPVHESTRNSPISEHPGGRVLGQNKAKAKNEEVSQPRMIERIRPRILGGCPELTAPGTLCE